MRPYLRKEVKNMDEATARALALAALSRRTAFFSRSPTGRYLCFLGRRATSKEVAEFRRMQGLLGGAPTLDLLVWYIEYLDRAVKEV